MVTADTNIVFYALTTGEKTDRAEAVLATVDFLSVQVLNEYAHASHRKLRREWEDVARDLELLRLWVDVIKPIEVRASEIAVRLAGRYRISFYDALLLAVAMESGARTFYTEDMQHGLVVDGSLTIVNPFLTDTP